MNRNTVEAPDEEKEIIRQNLACYPVLSSIIPRNPLLYRVAFDQYGGKIPPERFEEIAEFSLGGFLLHSEEDEEFRDRLQRVEGWLALYPEYANAEFGRKLLNHFLNFSSELEVYDALKRAGWSPERDVSLEGMVEESKNMKNLDFRVRPDGRDILIEVTTPRMSLEADSMYSDTPHAGFFDPSRGIERDGYAGPSRAEIVVENKVINQILEATSDTDCPVILIINCTYAYPEIMGFGDDVSGRISGIIHYWNGTSEFRSTRGCDLSEKEKQFFACLMGPSRAEWLQRILAGKNKSRGLPTDQETP
ncbi:hypothetical protein [Methanoculleus sp.]|uniref:hypothetical protein n=1 Tax=Methanoculleus sp. TaxID=90427 RepID=UPI001BD6C080|nr:hypothetical protein [Methanoculleus sp.]